MRRWLTLTLALSIAACSGDNGDSPTAPADTAPSDTAQDASPEDTGTEDATTDLVEPEPDAPDDVSQPDTMRPDTMRPDTGVRADVSSQGDAPSVENPEVTVPPAASTTRRLTTDMLQASIPIVLGNDAEGEPITWELGQGRGRENGFDRLSATLGRPDYVGITEEVRAPTALYIKLMEDMALDVCVLAVEADYAGDRPGGDPVLVRFAGLDETAGDGIEANMRYLFMRFLSANVRPGDERLIGLKAVFDAGVASDDEESAKAGWTAVCVALLTHPTFHLY